MAELSDREERYALWMATPRADRRPQTLVDLADELDVHVSQLYRWRRRPAVRARALEIVDAAVGGAERVAQVLEAVFTSAINGSVKDRELFLKYAGVLVDRREVKQVEPDEIAEMDDEALHRELESYKR